MPCEHFGYFVGSFLDSIELGPYVAENPPMQLLPHLNTHAGGKNHLIFSVEFKQYLHIQDNFAFGAASMHVGMHVRHVGNKQVKVRVRVGRG